jgi:hypothetical protein
MNYETIFAWILVVLFCFSYFIRWIIDIRRNPKIIESEGATETIKKNEKPQRKKTRLKNKIGLFVHNWKIHPSEIFELEYVSYSRIMSYKKCPRSFEIKYLCRKNEKSSRAAQIGKLTHQVIQLYTEEHRNDINRKIKKNNALEDLLKFYGAAIASDEITYPILTSEVTTQRK